MSEIRNEALDLTRGVIVALMALDHTRIFFTAAPFDPLDLNRTDAVWFLMRWITHLCAPGFFFIAGMSAWLMQQASDDPVRTAKFLLARGAWLIFLELAVFGLAWSFRPGWFWFGVIWGLGASMLLLASALYLPRWLILAAAATFTLLHNAAASMLDPGHPAIALLYSGGLIELPGAGQRLIIYPLLPWAALMLLGYATAPWLVPGGVPQVRKLAVAGAIALLGFLLTRLAGYGEPVRGGWEAGGGAARTLMSFFNAEKYPPSLQFSLVTLGLLALCLALFQRWRPKRAASVDNPVYVYGRVPFFFYALHLFVIHGLALAAAAAAGWPTGYLFWSGALPNLQPPPGYGLGQFGVLAAWLAVLTILYPSCRLFVFLKRRHPRALRFF